MRSAMSRICAGDIFPNLFPRVMSRTKAPAFSHVPRCCGEWGSVKNIGAPMGAGVKEGVYFPMTALGAGVQPPTGSGPAQAGLAQNDNGAGISLEMRIPL